MGGAWGNWTRAAVSAVAASAPGKEPKPGRGAATGGGAARRDSGCDVWLSAGIQVRHDQDLGYMHHKFAIVDRKVLITGSLNWTTQAIQNNRENVLILEDEEYVRLFLAEFERIWEEFNPAKYTFFPSQKQRSR